MKFYYQARTKTGEIKSGIIEASSKEIAIDLLKHYNFYVTLLKEATPAFSFERVKFLKEIFEKVSKRISKREIINFYRQLAIMFKAEIPLVEVLTTLAKQVKNPVFEEKILDMTEKIKGGASLSKVFAFYPELFNPFFINMVKSGEVSGKLAEVFSYLSDYTEKEFSFQQKIRGAMIYPIFILLVFFIIATVIVFFVLPHLEEIFQQAGVKLPLITIIFLGILNFLKNWFWFFILILIGLFVFIFYYLKTKEGREFFDKNLLKIPLLGSFLKKVYLSRFALNLSTLISGGLPIAESLAITAEVVGNTIYKSILLKTQEGVKRGEQISNILTRYPKEIPPFFTQMIVVGEKTGKLQLSLQNTIDLYQKDIDQTVNNFTVILEPILIIFLGLMVAGLVFSVVLPLYQILFTI